ETGGNFVNVELMRIGRVHTCHHGGDKSLQCHGAEPVGYEFPYGDWLALGATLSPGSHGRRQIGCGTSCRLGAECLDHFGSCWITGNPPHAEFGCWYRTGLGQIEPGAVRVWGHRLIGQTELIE